MFIASAVKFNHTLQDLFLGDNKLISSDGQTLGAMLKGNDHLQLLDLRNNPLQVPFLIYLLLQLGSSSFFLPGLFAFCWVKQFWSWIIDLFLQNCKRCKQGLQRKKKTVHPCSTLSIMICLTN